MSNSAKAKNATETAALANARTDAGASSQADLAELVTISTLGAQIAANAWWVIAFTVAGAALMLAAAFLVTPVYRATAVLLPAGGERSSLSSVLSSALGQFGGLAGLVGINPGSGDVSSEETLAVLNSRQFTERFIVDSGILPKMYPDKWDAGSRTWKSGKAGRISIGSAVRRFNRSIRTVVQDKKSNLVFLEIDWTDRNDAANWANEIVSRINAEMRSRAIAKANASLDYLQKELAQTAAVDTRDSINRLIENQIKQRMIADVTPEYSFRVVDRAMVPDADEPNSPKKLLFLVVGILAGGFVGVLVAIARSRPGHIAA
jgi:uncharacterized protein involved in exopolysaccharide biosynthesis